MFTTSLAIRDMPGDTWQLIEPLTYAGNTDRFTIPAGFETDLASSPRALWAWFAPADYPAEAVLHDWLWNLNRDGSGPDPVDSDALFRRALGEGGAGPVRRWGAWWVVRTAAVVEGRPGRWGKARAWLFVAAGSVAVPCLVVYQGSKLFVEVAGCLVG